MNDIARTRQAESRVLYLIDQYRLSSAADTCVFNNGIFFKDAKKRDFRLTATLELVPLHPDCIERARIAFNKAIRKKGYQDFYGKQAIKSALLERAKKDGLSKELKSSQLWKDLTEVVYEGF